MSPEEKLAALLAEAAGLKAKAETDDFTDTDADRAKAISDEVTALRETIEKKKAATAALASLTAPVQDNDDDAAIVRAKGRTLGARFVESEAYKEFKEKNPRGVAKDSPVSVKATGLGTVVAKADPAPMTTTGANALPTALDDVDDLTYRPVRRLLQVVTRGRTSNEWIKYRQIVSKTNNASIVAEAATTTGTDAAGGLKPLSTLTTAAAEAKVFTYADGMEVTNQELSDDGIMQSLIDSTLTENIEIEIENILLNGDSSGSEEPDGILNTSGVLQQAFATDVPTTLRKAITKLRTTSGAQIKGVLLNPADNETWDLMKDAEARYLGSGPFGTGPGTAWGYERIESEVIPVGQSLIGDFSTIHLLDYEDLAVLAFNQHKDYAQRNLVYVRAELRAMQLIRNAARLCLVDLTA